VGGEHRSLSARLWYGVYQNEFGESERGWALAHGWRKWEQLLDFFPSSEG